MIAQKLFIDAETIYTHLANIRNALGARNAFEMLALLKKLRQEAALADVSASQLQTESETVQTQQEIGAASTFRFSPRGKAVFELLLQGMNNAEIAEHLGMGVSGVKRHREKMLLQNDCKSILELIAKHHGTSGMNGENPEGAHPQK